MQIEKIKLVLLRIIFKEKINNYSINYVPPLTWTLSEFVCRSLEGRVELRSKGLYELRDMK